MSQNPTQAQHKSQIILGMLKIVWPHKKFTFAVHEVEEGYGEGRILVICDDNSQEIILMSDLREQLKRIHQKLEAFERIL